MTKFKPSDTVRRVRNSTGEPDSFLAIKPGEFFTVREVITANGGTIKLLSSDGEYARAVDCELVGGVCECCGQALPPKPATIPVPAHEIPVPLTEEPKTGYGVWVPNCYGPTNILYAPAITRELFMRGLLYATEEEAQARYESIVAPTRREDV